MSGVIKSHSVTELAAVRPFAGQMPPAPVVVLPRLDEERERLRRAVAALEGELRRRDVEIEVLRTDVEQAFEDGKAKGREAGLAEARDRQEERLAALEAAARKAQGEVSSGLASLERLAPLLARDCVDKILGEASGYAELIGPIVVRQLADIDRAMLLRIEVSHRDFPDAAALSALGHRLAPLAVDIVADAQMAPGGCVMVLKLGRMHVGIDQQWTALRDVLGEMAAPEAAP
ncbi:MAG: hypothetical protein WDM91_23615 [Rhizomicrobium sp.]